ncbi:MAG: ATP-dependent protease ATPase subunit HslU [Methanoregulaceae archaeon]|nr:ATP-dependent protease ATPase subunit HslU [Methanoregulaceae archaeon]
MRHPVEELTPRQIVAELDKYIVGQAAAKRAVAVALRNRYRRQQVAPAERDDILPKNILMIGPTGVGKTEIARRLAQLARAPFVKVEATKFTEVGYVGRDVESIIRELVANAVRLVERERAETVQHEAEVRAEERLLDLLESGHIEREPAPSFTDNLFRQALEAFGGNVPTPTPTEPQPEAEEEVEAYDPEKFERERQEKREALRAQLRAGELDKEYVEVDTEEPNQPFVQVFSAQGMEEMGLDSVGGFGTRTVTRRITVADARPLLIELEAQTMIDKGSIHREAIERAEQTGIVFLDEIDKVAIKSQGSGPDVSREGVQRDLLPIIEGSTVPTKFGPARTDHILFIAAGAFHMASPSDLIPELQGRLPIRVTLDDLGESDFRRILREPRNALTKQYEKLLATEGVKLNFSEGALDVIAYCAAEVNKKTENIGARRLHTIMERLLEDLLFDAPECGEMTVNIDDETVRSKILVLVKNLEENRYIL